MVSQEQMDTNCLLQILKLLLSNFPRRKLYIFCPMTNTTNPGLATEEKLNPVLVPVLKKVMKKLVEYTDKVNNEDEEAIPSKLATTVAIFSIVFNELDNSDDMEQVKEWINRYINKLEVEDPIVIKPIVTLLLQSVIKLKPSSSLGLEVAKGLHSLTWCCPCCWRLGGSVSLM